MKRQIQLLRMRRYWIMGFGIALGFVVGFVAAMLGCLYVWSKLW